jgi:hypothetical protein
MKKDKKRLRVTIEYGSTVVKDMQVRFESDHKEVIKLQKSFDEMDEGDFHKLGGSILAGILNLKKRSEDESDQSNG